jgi:hypothetical protein
LKNFIIFLFAVFFCTSIFTQQVSGARWTNLGPLSMQTQNIGFVSSFWVGDGLMYAGSLNGGLWKGTKCNTDTCKFDWYWTNITDSWNLPGTGINAFEVKPGTAGQTIYIATQLSGNGRYFSYSHGILKTEDGGRTWKKVGPDVKLKENRTVDYLKMCADNPEIMFADISKKFYYTTDGWKTFVELKSPVKNTDKGVQIGDVEWKPGDPKTIYLTTRSEAGIKSEFYVSRDAGMSWEDFKPQIKASNIQLDVWRSPGKENFIFIAYGDPAMYIQVYDGKSWSGPRNKGAVSHFAGSVYWNMEFDVNDTDTSVMYVSTTQISRSLDGGRSFKTISDYWGPASHADIREMKIVTSTPGGKEDVVALGNDGGISVSKPGISDNSGWMNANGFGLSIAQFWGLGTSETDPQFIVGGGQDNGIYSCTNGEWRAQAMGVGDGYDALVSDSDPTYALGEGNSPGLSASGNKGISWSGMGAPPGPANIFKRALLQDKENHLVWLGHHQLWMKDNANGKLDAKWLQKSFIPDIKGKKTGAMMNSYINCFAIGGKNNSVGLLAYNGALWGNDSIQGKVFYSENVNEAKPVWKDVSRFIKLLDWREFHDVVMDPVDSRKFYVHLNNPYGGFETEIMEMIVYGNGDSVGLTNIEYDLPDMPRGKFAIEKNELANLYLATDSGVYFTNSELLKQKHWERFQGAEGILPFCNISDMEINYATNRLYISTYGRGIWYSPLAETGMDKPVVIKTNTVWDQRKKIDGELIVEAKKTLTITNETFISSKAKITLKKKAKLIIKQSGRKQVILSFSGGVYDTSKVVKMKRAKLVVLTQ